jgi:hypothetical protein
MIECNKKSSPPFGKGRTGGISGSNFQTAELIQRGLLFIMYEQIINAAMPQIFPGRVFWKDLWCGKNHPLRNMRDECA